MCFYTYNGFQYKGYNEGLDTFLKSVVYGDS